jgi:hypothetical protein
MGRCRCPNALDLNMTRHDLRTLTMMLMGLACGGVAALGLHHFAA